MNFVAQIAGFLIEKSQEINNHLLSLTEVGNHQGVYALTQERKGGYITMFTGAAGNIMSSHLRDLAPLVVCGTSYGETVYEPVETVVPLAIATAFEESDSLPKRSVRDILLTRHGGVWKCYAKHYRTQVIDTSEEKVSRWTGNAYTTKGERYAVTVPYYGEIPLTAVLDATPVVQHFQGVVAAVYTPPVNPVALMSRDELERALSLKKWEVGRLRGEDKRLAQLRLDILTEADVEAAGVAAIEAADLPKEPEKTWTLADLAGLQNKKKKRK